jgi:putative Mg2+ transporter-C (MgtC) family protein
MPVTEFDILLRLILSFAAGFLIGIERASRHQVAGMRTHILIALGSSLLMLLSIWIPQEFIGLKNGDPGRIAAQVVSGIGFLGAGAMIRLGNTVKGVTTAASLWLIAAVGLAIGAGMFFAAAVVLALSLIALRLIEVFERRCFPVERTKVLEIYYKNRTPKTEAILDILRQSKVRVISVDVNAKTGIKGENKNSVLRVLAGIPTTIDISSLVSSIKIDDHIERIKLKENF